MSMFVEVDSVEKSCPVILNLDEVVEIAPLRGGGCEVFFGFTQGVGVRASMKVSNNYDEFKQFVMQKVSADDIAKRFPKNKKIPTETVELSVPQFLEK